jgi:hypothetical protein
MADTLTLYTPLVIDLKGERDRISTPRLYNGKQRKVLLKLIDLFEEGNIQDMIELAQCDKSKALFCYPVWEFLGDPYYDVISKMSLYGIEYKRKENI